MVLRILAILNIRRGEERNVLLMLTQYFFMGAAMLFVQSASLALFFTAWDSASMPYIYLGIAVIVSSITATFLKISERTSLARFLVLCVLFVLFGSIALRIGLAFTHAKWLLLALPIWSQTLINITVAAFWTLAGNVFDVRQGKRIFGLMNAGSWLAYAIMGPFTTPLVNAIGTENLYIVIAVCLLISFFLQQAVIRANPSTSTPPLDSQNHEEKTSIRQLFRNRYITLIFTLVALWRVSYFILDNIFYDRTALQYPSVDQLAGFIGGFFGIVGILGFVTDMFLTGRIISRFGLRAGLLTTPTLTVLCVGAFAVAGLVNPTLLPLLFGLAVAGKFTNEGLGFSLDLTSTNLLYQPIHERIRIRAQTFAEGIIQPLAIGTAGGLLLLFNTILKFNEIQLALIYLVSAAAWIIVAYSLTRAYPVALTEALHKRRFGDKGILLTDIASIEIVQNSLKSNHPAEVLYALDLLERSESETLTQDILSQIHSPFPEVRKYALESVQRLKVAEGLHEVQHLLTIESDLDVRESAACTFVVLSKDIDTSLGLLEQKDVAVQHGALIGLLRANKLERVPVAFKKLQLLAKSASADERVTATEMIGKIGNENLGELLLPLLNDADLNVQRAALQASPKINCEENFQAIVKALGAPHTRSLAFSALVVGGNKALPQIISSLKDETLHRRVHLRLIRACSHIKSEEAIHVLEGLIAHPNAGIRSRALIALHDCSFKPERESAQMVRQQVEAEFRRAAWLLGCWRNLERSSKTEVVIRAAEQDIQETIHRLFLMFGFLYDERAIRRAQNAIRRQDAARRSYAIEIIDTTLSREHKTPLIALLEKFPPNEKLEKMGTAYKQQTLPPAGRILDLLENPLAYENPWLVATAIEVAAQFGISTDSQTLQAMVGSNESLLVRMTNQKVKETGMLSTVERVIVLKSLSMFAETPDEALVELADLLHEMQLPSGEIIVKKGEVGDSLYIIVDGKVEVLDEHRVLNQLEPRAVFGELALLDSSPRTATIRTIEDTTLLRLDQTPFYEIMSDYVEVAMGTIQMLTRILRTRTSTVLELSKMLNSEAE